MGQVFTPPDIVCEMLDKIGFCGDDVLCKTIMEPSFGDGAFLIEIVRRIIKQGEKTGLSKAEILRIISTNVLGIEKDTVYYQKAIERIRELLKENGIQHDVDFPLLKNNDTLSTYSLYEHKVDYVVGNPPYVNTHNIKNKDEIKRFSFSKKGMTDLYIVFFEIGLKMLNENGKLCFITPNSYFNSIAGKIMREYIIENKLLTYIKNYGHYQVFDNITTYCCITLLDKTHYLDKMIYVEKDMREKELNYSSLYLNGNFYFNQCCDFANIIGYDGEQHCKVKNGCATLMDSFFIDSYLSENSKYSIPIVKASTDKKYKCFYPYDKNGSLISFESIQNKEPNTAEYLLNNREILEKRAIDKPEYWYAFGRTQSIADTYKDKYTINTLYKIVDDIHIASYEAGIAVYGGLYIITDIDIETIKKLLKSKDYLDYVKTIGRYKSGGYYTITSKEIEKYLNYKISKNE